MLIGNPCSVDQRPDFRKWMQEEKFFPAMLMCEGNEYKSHRVVFLPKEKPFITVAALPLQRRLAL
jgi:hypothetical protein